MTKKIERPRSTYVIGQGTRVKILRARNGIVSSDGRRESPREMWSGVSKADIGTHFEPVEPVLSTEQDRKKKRDREEQAFRNKFIKGKSKFLWFWIVPKAPKKAEKPKPQPVNYKNKLDKKTRRQFTGTLDKNIERTSSFMMKDVFPISLSLFSGMSKADELAQQLVEGKVDLPMSYMEGKARQAINLRIIRFVSELFELNEEERRLMSAEFTRPWSQS